MYNKYFNPCLHIIGPWEWVKSGWNELVSGGNELVSGGNELVGGYELRQGFTILW